MTISCQRNPVYGNSANFTVNWQQSPILGIGKNNMRPTGQYYRR